MKNKLFLVPLLTLCLAGCSAPQEPDSPDPVEPSEPSNPSEPGEPSEPSNPSEPGEPSDTVYGYDYYENYYGQLTWTDGDDLKEKLYYIISEGKVDLRYEANWESNKNADQALYDFEYVDVVYSETHELKTNTSSGGKGWQREHSFPASLMTGFVSGDAVGVHGGRATDFHNLFASNGSANSSRGNKNFGYADENEDSYTNRTEYKFDINTFEPNDNDKGRLARAIFYMGVMYSVEEQQNVKVKLNYNAADQIATGNKTTTVTIPVTYKPLEIVEEEIIYEKETYTNFYYQNNEKCKALVAKYGEGPEGYARYSEDNCQFKIGNLSDLLEWNSHTVDYLEYQHNEQVYSNENLAQCNRNPFVDYPELVDYVYGDKKNEAGDLKYLKPSYVALDMDEDEIHHYAIKSATRTYNINGVFDETKVEIVGVKNNLETVPKDFAFSSLNNSYTFTEDDATNGTKSIVIKTPINDLKLDVTVNETYEPGSEPSGGTITYDTCNYIYNIEGSAKGKDFNGFVKGSDITLGSVTWNVDWTNTEGAISSNNATYGLQFGIASGGRTMNELTFATTTSLNVNAVYFVGSCASGKTINYTIKVGGNSVKTGTISRDSSTTGPETVGVTLEEAATGIVEIIINGSGASSGAIYMKSLALNIC